MSNPSNTHAVCTTRLLFYVRSIVPCVHVTDLPLPGLERVEATFDGTVLPAYCDHWVSSARCDGGRCFDMSHAALLADTCVLCVARATRARVPQRYLRHILLWQVSNVRSRVGFLKTMEETLGFTPKVDFNAGVVAAGDTVGVAACNGL